ncbi:sialate O-acetylesterase [Desulfosarcina ovata]|uniref:Sialate O-acetylesterase domain-containing protein n=1 Tax=Desulfosarcina ovata subsp. ovata TaxID=2752305 RepID=A0A5K8A5D3_9BACT|nr:sialate O-acetylesterase [Desulfosarcina ovata]BBO87697.1 hypothetical protein DSCOOX_08770 [Desulfosarcina ovata subsp. ovata]
MASVKKFFVIIFVAMLSLPATGWITGTLQSNSDNTVNPGFPRPEPGLWFDRDYYRAIEGWFRETLPMAETLKVANHWLDYHIFSASSIKAVHVGRRGWLFWETKQAEPENTEAVRQAGHRLCLALHATESIVNATESRFLVALIPGKAAIYPEYTGVSARADRTSLYGSLMEANRRFPINGLVKLEPVLKKAKLSGQAVYGKRSRLWCRPAAAAAAGQILTAARLAGHRSNIATNDACPPGDDDLYRLLLGRKKHAGMAHTGYRAGPFAVDGPVATIYGDDYLIGLLPSLTRAFSAATIIDATQVSTLGQDLLAHQSEMILLECGQETLGRLHLELEAFYTAAQDRLQGVVTRPIALQAADPVGLCALDITDNGLKIRASGDAAAFSLPAITGSTSRIFRMAKLTFAAGHHGPVSVKTLPDRSGPIQKQFGQGTGFMLVPLPFDESVDLIITPSQKPGVFTLQKAELISFYGDQPIPLPPLPEPAKTIGDIYSGLPIADLEPPPVLPVVKPAPAPPVAHPTQTMPELALTDIEEGCIFQRKHNAASIVVSGSYTGIKGPVEARVLAADDESVRVPWTVVDDAPQNGVFTGILAHVPQGGWYRLEVRSALTPWVVKKGRHRWGVGMLVACIGQSNMHEWFATGTDHQPSPRLMIHRDGHWHRPTSTGNGALALGNRLAERLKIPIGLLNYSVNGTGLTARADWGTGFWLDTATDGIYRRFVNGVNRAGGSVEAVVWMQGEADAARGTISREAYRKALERLVGDHIRIDIRNGSSRPQLPFLMIPLVRRPTGKDRSCQWIRQAQMDALSIIDECHLAALSMDLENRGRQHLQPEAYTTLGLRTAQTVLYLLGKTEYHRGPIITSVAQVSNHAIDVTIRHRGGTDVTPAEGITGFEVLSGETHLPITAITRRDATTIRIEVASGLPADFRVRYLYGAHPNTTGAVRDNTALALPLEPYSDQ